MTDAAPAGTGHHAGARRRSLTIRALLGPAVSLALFAAAVLALRHALAEQSPAEILAAARALAPARVLAALLLTASSYLVLSLVDLTALAYVGARVRYAKVALTSFIGYAASHNLGITLLSSGSARFRLYSASGLAPLAISLVVLFCNATFWVGFFCLGGLLLTFDPLPLPGFVLLPFADSRPLGCAALAAYLVILAAVLRGGALTIRKNRIALPRLGLFVCQTAVGALDWLMAALVLHALLPGSLGLAAGDAIRIFLLAQVIAMASSVPGGVGVFESLLLFLLPAQADRAALFAALLVYRVIYYLLPLALAILLLVTREVRRAAVPRDRPPGA